MGPFTLGTIRDKYQPLHLSAGTANTSMWWHAVHKSVRTPNEWSGLSGSVAHIGSKQREWWKAGGGASPTLPQSELGTEGLRLQTQELLTLHNNIHSFIH